MTSIARDVNRYLQAILDIEDELYKQFFANDISYSDPIVTPNDFDIGMTANFLEWNRLLCKSLLKQMIVTTAEGKWLDFILHDHFGIVRFQSESDLDYVDRATDYIIGYKVSPASIINIMKPFSSPGLPVIYEGPLDSAFADVSFSDFYRKFQVLDPLSPFYLWHIYPAITASVMSSAYHFVLELQNTDPADIERIIGTVDRWKAAGISYEIRILHV